MEWPFGALLKFSLSNGMGFDPKRSYGSWDVELFLREIRTVSRSTFDNYCSGRGLPNSKAPHVLQSIVEHLVQNEEFHSEWRILFSSAYQADQLKTKEQLKNEISHVTGYRKHASLARFLRTIGQQSLATLDTARLAPNSSNQVLDVEINRHLDVSVESTDENQTWVVNYLEKINLEAKKIHADALARISDGRIDEATNLLKLALEKVGLTEEADLFRVEFRARMEIEIARLRVRQSRAVITYARSIVPGFAKTPDLFREQIRRLCISAMDSYETASRFILFDNRKLLNEARHGFTGALCTAMAHAKGFKDAQDIEARLSSLRVGPNVLSSMLLIRHAESFGQASRIVSRKIKEPGWPDLLAFNALIAKAGSISQGQRILPRMAKANISPDVYTFNSLIDKSKQLSVGWKIVREMKNKGIKPDIVTINTLLKTAADLSEGREVLEKIDGTEISPNVVTFNTLLGLNRSLDDIRTTILAMKEARIVQDGISTRVLRTKFGFLLQEAREVSYGLLVLAEMKAAGIPPDNRSFDRLLKLSVGVSESSKLLSEMRAAGISPRARTYRVLLHHAKDFSMAAFALTEMQAANFPANVVLYNCVLRLVQSVRELKQITSAMREAGVELNRFSSKIIRSRCDVLLSDAKGMSGGRAVFAAMAEAGVPPNARDFDVWLSKALSLPDQLKILEHRRAAGFPPSLRTMNILLGKSDEEAQRQAILSDMKSSGISPNRETYRVLVSKAASVSDGQSLIREMQSAGFSPDTDIFNSLISLSKNVREATRVLSMMSSEKVSVDRITGRTFVKFVCAKREANTAIHQAAIRNLADTEFVRSVVAVLARKMDANALLKWVFTRKEWENGDQRISRSPMVFESAIRIYTDAKRLRDALRIASAFPFLSSSRRLFRLHPNATERYLIDRYDSRFGEEPHYASYALAILFEELENVSKRREWACVAMGYQENRDAPKRLEHIKALASAV